MLSGQTCTSKTITINALTYKIFHEQRFPVVRITDPNISFSVAKPTQQNSNFTALDRLLTYLENITTIDKKQATSILIVWDCSEWNISTVARLQKKLNSRGRKAVILFTSIKCEKLLYGKNDCEYVEASVLLDATEIESLKTLLKDNERLNIDNIERWVSRLSTTETKHLFGLLYYLFDDMHPTLASGLFKEAKKSTVEIFAEAEIIEKNSGGRSHEYGTMFLELQRWGYIPDDVKVEQESENNISCRINFLFDSLALLSSLRVPMPQSMAMSILNFHETTAEQRLLYRIFQLPWLSYQPFNKNEDAFDYTLQFRTFFEGELWLLGESPLSHRVIGENEQIGIVLKLLDILIEENSYSQNACLNALEWTIRELGPNKAQMDKGKTISAENGMRIADKLGELRENGLLDERLVTQEVTFLREFASNKNKDENLEQLKRAYKIACQARETLLKERCADEEVICSALLVESLLSGISCQENSSERIIDYPNSFNLLSKAISENPMNSYQYHVLCKLTLLYFKDDSIDGVDKWEKIARAIEILENAEMNVQGVVDSFYFETDKIQILKCLRDKRELEKYQKVLFEKGSATGIYLAAWEVLANVNFSYRDELVNAQQTEACETALSILEDDINRCVVDMHAPCQFMRINLRWILCTGKPVFYGRGPLFTQIKNDDWNKIQVLAKTYAEKFLISSKCKYENNACVVYYLLVLSSAQLNDFEMANAFYKDLRTATSDADRRVQVKHLLCDENGVPKKFSATFDKKHYRVEKRAGYAAVDQVKSSNNRDGKNRDGRIYYYHHNIQSIAIDGIRKDDVQIGLTFLDWSLYRGQRDKGDWK